MTKLEWEDWEKDPQVWDAEVQNPYVNWWNQTETRNLTFDGLPLVAMYRNALSSPPRRNSGDVSKICSEAGNSKTTHASPTKARRLPKYPGYDGQHPLNPKALNPRFDSRRPWIPNDIRADAPDKDTVIVGVIDDGISYCHQEFMQGADPAKTRVLAAWQQDAPWAGPTDADAAGKAPGGTMSQTYLPYGREFYQHDIEELMRNVTTNGHFDQDAFNSAAGLVDMTDPRGPRSLARRVGHGTHVADLAAGSEETALMFANLPDRKTVGLSGTFLEFYFLSALLRMINLADALWSREFGAAAGKDDLRGYAMVFNLSFSKSAGARDAVTGIARELVNINAERAACNWSRIYLSLPAGNDNLREGIAEFSLAKGDNRTVTLDVVPEDHSPSFVEIWTNEIPADPGLAPPGLEIGLTPPGNPPDRPSTAVGGSFKDLKQDENLVARIYTYPVVSAKDAAAQEAEKDPPEFVRQNYVLAIRPTYSNDPTAPLATAGPWQVRLTNATEHDMQVAIAVQSDQSVLPSSNNGRRPLLRDTSYRRFDDEGRVRDSYTYVGGDKPQKDLDGYIDREGDRLVFRHGSLSALALSFVAARDEMKKEAKGSDFKDFIAISTAHRRTDGRPAGYASTGTSLGEVRNTRAEALGLASKPTVSLPCEASATLPGIMAAGARRGSKVLLSGTSFAAAQTTRYMAEILREEGNFGHDADVITKLLEKKDSDLKITVPVAKGGDARLKSAIDDDGRLTSIVSPPN